MTTHSSKERPRHLNVALEDDLHALKERVGVMGQLVDEQVAASVEALLCRDTTAAHAVVSGDRLINELEREIDAHCVRILALFQPVASDLRFVAAVLKIVTDLERIGDFAVNIAKSVDGLGSDRLTVEQELPDLLAGALGVLRRALAAFLLRNGTEAELASKATCQSRLRPRGSGPSCTMRSAVHQPRSKLPLPCCSCRSISSASQSTRPTSPKWLCTPSGAKT